MVRPKRLDLSAADDGRRFDLTPHPSGDQHERGNYRDERAFSEGHR